VTVDGFAKRVMIRPAQPNSRLAAIAAGAVPSVEMRESPGERQPLIRLVRVGPDVWFGSPAYALLARFEARVEALPGHDGSWPVGRNVSHRKLYDAGLRLRDLPKPTRAAG